MKEKDFMILVSNFIKKSLEHERVLAHSLSVSRLTVHYWASGRNFPFQSLRFIVVKMIKKHDCECECRKIIEGTIFFLNRFGEQGGYGVIVDRNNNQHIFTLGDVEDYYGGDLARVGYIKNALTELTVDSDAKVNMVRLKR